MAISKKDKEPACTFLVETFLKEADDFRTMKQIVAATRLTANQVAATLSHFKKYKAANSLESDGDLWWFLTPDYDQRSRKTKEKVKEEPGSRKVRNPRKKKETELSSN